MTTARQLFREIDKLPFPARQRLLAERAKALAGSATLHALLDELHDQAEHRAFARRVALHLACVARDSEYVERCLTVEETDVLAGALVAAVRLGVPGPVLAARLPELPVALRRRVYHAVRRHRATDLAEALLPVARARFGDREAAALVAVCSPSTVAVVLPELGYAIASWGMIGHRHPGITLDYLDAQLSATPRSAWERLWTRLGAGVAAAVPAEPERILALLERSGPHVTPPVVLGRTLGAIARHDPARLLRVLLDPRRSGPVPGGRGLWRALLGASDADLIGVGRTVGTMELDRFLRTLPPARRAVIYAGIVGPGDLAGMTGNVDVLDALPAAARAREAERLLALPTVADDPSTRLAVTARLPWPRARDTLREATRRPTADERAEAYPLYISAAAATRDPAVFGEVLGTLGRLANEQDPVRRAALHALGGVPPWLYRPTDADVVVKIVTDAGQARDCSWSTQRAIRDLAGRLIREGAVSRHAELVDAGLRAFELLGQQLSRFDLSGLDRSLPSGAEHEVFDALRPRIAADARRGRYGVVLALAGALGRRAWEMPRLQEFVAEARTAKDDATVGTAISLWLDPPATRDERIEQTLRADRSTIVLPAVQHRIGWRRTDLLDEVFAKSPHGRFLERGVRYIPPFHGCFARWLPRQAAAYAKLLNRLGSGRRVPVWERADAVRRLGKVPGTAGLLRGYLDDAEIAVVEAALSALAWTDEPADALPTLLSYADTDRARVAVYAATRCARFVPPDRLGEALRPVLAATKVTSRKEAARLLAEYQAGGAIATLLGAWAAPDQHRDVRRALVSASRWLLDDDRAWELLGQAATAEHAVSTALLDLDSETIAERHRPRYAALVHTVAAAPDADTARLGLATMPRWSRWDKAGTGMLVDRVTDLASTASWRVALPALIAGADSVENPEPLRAVATRLLGADGAGAAGPNRDLPARQRLLELAGAVAAAARTSPVLRAAAGELADLVAAEPTLRRVAVELAVTAVPLDSAGAELEALRRVAELADRPIWAWHAHHALHGRVRGLVPRLQRQHLFAVAETLAGETGPAALLAIAIADAAGAETGWPDQWRDLIHTLRRHPDPDVRLAALDTFTSPE